MTINDLLTLMDREQQTLADENNHSAAAIMREAAATIRRFANHVDGQGEARPARPVR